MKVLTRTEEEEHYEAVIRGGLRWGSYGTISGTTGAVLANRYWAGFRNLTLPLKAFAVTSIGTFSLMIGADRASRAYEDRQQFQEEELNQNETWNQFHLENDHDHSHQTQILSPRDSFLAHLKENQFKIILGGWAASMVGSFGLVAAQPLPFTQKLVQARMYAQSLTVAMIIASAAIASLSNSSKSNDNLGGSLDQDPRTNSMYKFKKGSPHDLREQEIKSQKSF